MAAVTRARLQTAYQAGYQAEDGPPPDYIATDAELLDAWDKGFADRQDGRRSTGPDTPPPAQHRANPRPRRTTSTSTARRSSTRDSSPPAGERVDEQLPPTQPSRPAAKRSQPLRDARATVRKITLSPSTDNLGGFVLGVVVYLAAIQYIRNGPGAPLRWFRAKAMNKVSGGISADEAHRAQQAVLQSMLGSPASAEQGGTFGPGGTPVTPTAPGGSPDVLDPIGIITGGGAPRPAPTSGSLAGQLGVR